MSVFTLRKLPIVSGRFSKEFLEIDNRSSLTSCPTETVDMHLVTKTRRIQNLWQETNPKRLVEKTSEEKKLYPLKDPLRYLKKTLHSSGKEEIRFPSSIITFKEFSFPKFIGRL